MKPWPRFFAAAVSVLLTFLLVPSLLRADAGLLRISEPDGPYQISVFTEPTPLRVDGGRIHVFVADRETGRPVEEAHVRFQLESQSGGTTPREHAHRRPRGLRFSAGFSAPNAGRFATRIEVTGQRGAGSVSFAIDIAPNEPLLVSLGPALAVPPLGIALFGLHQVLVRRRATRRQTSRRIAE